jgi:hypothetical protein
MALMFKLVFSSFLLAFCLQEPLIQHISLAFKGSVSGSSVK